MINVLQFLDKLKLIHLNIKPSNILKYNINEYKISDYGIINFK